MSTTTTSALTTNNSLSTSTTSTTSAPAQSKILIEQLIEYETFELFSDEFEDPDSLEYREFVKKHDRAFGQVNQITAVNISAEWISTNITLEDYTAKAKQTNGRASLIDTTEIDLVLTGPMIKVYMKVTYIKEDARNIDEFTDNDITQIEMETKSIYKSNFNEYFPESLKGKITGVVLNDPKVTVTDINSESSASSFLFSYFLLILPALIF